MNYIYDILLNFNSQLYDFYDWNITDEIKHIRKIPIFKVKSEYFFEIKNNKVKFDDEFLSTIKFKTEEFLTRKTKSLEYAFILSDGLEALAIYINDELLYSSLLIDEEKEVLEIANKLSNMDIKYQILSEVEINLFKTRKEIEIENIVKNEFNKIIQEDNIEKLKYIYFECFNIKVDSKEKIVNELTRELNNKFVIKKINDFINLKTSK